MKKDEKQENVDNTQSRKTKKSLDRNLNESNKGLLNILIHLQPSAEGKDFTSNLRDILS